jgi:serine protease Do
MWIRKLQVFSRCHITKIVGPGGSGKLEKLGLPVRQLTPELAQRLRLNLDEGVVISQIDPDGLAARAGLETGDVILMVNNNQIETVKDLQKALRDGEEYPYIRFLVQRGQIRIFVGIKQPSGKKG